MAGDEAGFPAGDFAEVYAIVADAGLGCTIHAGEWAGADSVRAALELPVTRISHGVRAIEDPSLVAELAARGIVLECCPTSNVVLGVYPSYEDAPAAAAARRRRQGHARLRRPALLRRHDRGRVRGVRGADGVHLGGSPRDHRHRDRRRVLRRRPARDVAQPRLIVRSSICSGDRARSSPAGAMCHPWKPETTSTSHASSPPR